MLFCRKNMKSEFISNFICIFAKSKPKSADWWVMDDDILESVIDALFLTVWTTTIKSQSKTNAEVNATGVVYTPGVCRGLTMPSRTLFGVHYIHDRRGYSDSVCSLVGLWKASDSGTDRWGYPAFCMFETRIENPLTLGVSVRTMSCRLCKR